MRAVTLTTLMCAGIVLALISFANFPTLQPQFEALWGLSKTQSGLIAGMFFGGVLAGTPLLSTLADKFDPRRIWIASTLLMAASSFAYALLAEGFWTAMAFRFLTGFGLAGVYMPGLKILTDRLEGPAQSRATVVYTASFIIGFAASYKVTGLMTEWIDWQAAFMLAGACCVTAALMVLPIPRAEAHHFRSDGSHVLDFRPVFRARPAMAFITAYGSHCWEAFTLGSWMVAFLTFHLATNEPNLDPWLGPVEIATLAGLIGFPSSIIGNELCLRFGRRRMIMLISLTSACVSGTLGFLLGLPYIVLAIWTGLTTFCLSLDSGSISYGMVQRAPKGYTAATMAVHSMAGFAAGLAGPFIFGAVLDLAGDTTMLGWGLAFLSIGVFALGAPFSMAFLGRKDDPGT